MPRNLTVRPSGLLINELPPMIPGLAAGTAVHTWDQRERFRKAGVHICPAYDISPEQKKAKRGQKISKSCEYNETGPCRVCWNHPEIPVSYQLHPPSMPRAEQAARRKTMFELMLANANVSPDLAMRPFTPKWVEKTKTFDLMNGPALYVKNMAYPQHLHGPQIKDGDCTPALFSITAKMNALSISTPAGHPSVTGGCCPMASLAHLKKLQKGNFKNIAYPSLSNVKDQARIVCSLCYATGNRYIYLANARQKAAMMRWMNLNIDKKNFIGESLAHAFKFAQEWLRSSFSGVPGTTWGRIVKINPDYFRFFDSGDLGDHASALFEEILHFTSSCPDAKFWLPTRTWVYGAHREHMISELERFHKSKHYIVE